jgi:hypothetical protein
MVVGQNIPAAKSMIEQMLRVFRMPDKQAWIGSPSWQQLGQLDPMTGQPMGMPMMPGMPGMPGMPPMGGPPGAPPMMPPGGPPMPPQGA